MKPIQPGTIVRAPKVGRYRNYNLAIVKAVLTKGRLEIQPFGHRRLVIVHEKDVKVSKSRSAAVTGLSAS